MKNKPEVIGITIVCLILGFIISIQYHTQIAATSDLTLQSNENLVIILGDMNSQRISLSNKEKNLTHELAILKESNTSKTAALENLNNEGKKLSIATEATDIIGPGIVITFATQSNLIATDFIDILNELWGTGAEGISVNEIRITNKSSFYTRGTEAGEIIYLNNAPLTFPLEIKAIGDSAQLATGITFPGGILEVLKDENNLEPIITQSEEIILPKAATAEEIKKSARH